MWIVLFSPLLPLPSSSIFANKPARRKPVPQSRQIFQSEFGSLPAEHNALARDIIQMFKGMNKNMADDPACSICWIVARQTDERPADWPFCMSISCAKLIKGVAK